MENKSSKKVLVKQIEYNSDEENEEDNKEKNEEIDKNSDDDNFIEKKLEKKLETPPEKFRDKKRLLKSVKGLKNLEKQSQNDKSISAFETIVNLNPVETINIDDYIINIRVSQRNSKKYTTTIENIPSHFFDNKEVTNLMIKKMRDILASRATIKKDNIIEVSGNKIYLIIPIIQEYTNCSLSCIKVHGYS